jgi:hypothetical protein
MSTNHKQKSAQMSPKKSDDKKRTNGFQPRKKKSGGGKPDDDSSVDSHGNIRGLVDYDYDSSDYEEELTGTSSEDYTTSGKSDRSPIAHRLRSRARTNKKSPKNELHCVKESDEEDDEALIARLRSEKRRLAQRLKEKEEDEKLARLEERLEARERKRKEEEREERHRRLKGKVVESESEEEEEEEEEDSEEYEEEEEDEEDEVEETEEEDEDEEDDRAPGIILSFGGGDDMDRMIPKRHNMKKESAEVRKFVKLITEPSNEDTIDGQIDQFKALSEDQRKKLLNVLEHKGKNPGETQQSMMFKILTMNLPAEVQGMVLSKYNSLQMMDPGSTEYFKHRNWLDKLTSMPLGIYKELPVKITDGSETCGAFMERARKYLDEAIYGQDEAKLQVLQFIGTKIANPDGRGLSLLLSGPPGIGKTSLIKNGVAKALSWPFQFISLGGDSDASTYTGHQLVYESSHCGKIVNSLCAAKSMSLVLMFDELDKISTTPKGEEVQNLLVHMTDPVQNMEFEDKYLAGIPIDLSKVMFTFSANDLNKIDRVLLDRMVVIQLQGYSAKEKLAIAEHYLLPAALKEVGLAEKVGISKDVITYVLEHYAAEEAGVRELKRCMEQIAQKVNMLRMFNTKDLPFHIKDFSLPFVLKKEHVDLFLKKKKTVDESIQHLYV